MFYINAVCMNLVMFDVCTCTLDKTGTVESTGGHMFLKFVSNGVVEGRGFYLEYTFEGKLCDRVTCS